MTDMGQPPSRPDESAEPTRDLSSLPGNRDHHVVAPQPWLAGASDRGHRHETNQDALSLAGREVDGARLAVLVISDGVSTSLGADQAALTAATVAGDRLVSAVAGHENAEEAFEAAFSQANAAILATVAEGREPGSCTLIAALSDSHRAVVGNVGDSRCYFVGDSGSGQVLSTDDSVAQARIELGMPREEAERGFQAHAITRWLGPDATDVSPRVTSFDAPEPGWLLVCTDGLWNYASEADELAALVARLGAELEPVALAERLVAWANEQGGRDNVTVALTRLAPAVAPAG